MYRQYFDSCITGHRNEDMIREAILPEARYTVYALTFMGLNFRGFRGSTTIREHFAPRKPIQGFISLAGDSATVKIKTQNVKTRKPRKFNPAKVKVYTVLLHYWLHLMEERLDMTVSYWNPEIKKRNK